MRSSRVLVVAVLAVLVTACGGKVGGTMTGGDDDDDGPLPAPSWTLDVDMSSTDRYVVGAFEQWPVSGVATASAGLDGVEVAGGPVVVDASGAFSAHVSVAPGLTLVPVIARDLEGHARQAHRTLLAATFLPEDTLAPQAAGLRLTDAVLAGMAGPLTEQAGEIDVAGLILAREVLSVDERCVTWPVAAQQQPAQIALELDGPDLWLNVRVPGLYVYFEGQCQGLLSQIPIAGEMAMDIDVWSRLSPGGDGGACLEGFQHSAPFVQLPGFGFDVWGTSGPLQGWLIELGSAGKAQEAHDQLRSELAAQSDELLDEKLASLKVFDETETMTLLGQPVDLHLCLTALEEVGDGLVARVGATARGSGDREAPGAPLLGGAVVAPGAGELLLDADLVAQLLFSSWRAGGLAQAGAQQVDFALFALLAPGLADAFPDALTVDVDIDGELPPVVRASPVEGADLRIEIGDLMLDLRIGDVHIFRLGARLTLDLDLTPEGAGLVPVLVASTAEVHLLDELVDADDAAVEAAVQLKVGEAAGALLAGARLALPQLPGLGAPTGVTPDAGGRWLHVHVHVP